MNLERDRQHAINKPSALQSRSHCQRNRVAASTGTLGQALDIPIGLEFGSPICMAVFALLYRGWHRYGLSSLCRYRTRITEHRRYFGCTAGRLTSR